MIISSVNQLHVASHVLRTDLIAMIDHMILVILHSRRRRRVLAVAYTGLLQVLLVLLYDLMIISSVNQLHAASHVLRTDLIAMIDHMILVILHSRGRSRALAVAYTGLLQVLL